MTDERYVSATLLRLDPAWRRMLIMLLSTVLPAVVTEP